MFCRRSADGNHYDHHSAKKGATACARRKARARSQARKYADTCPVNSRDGETCVGTRASRGDAGRADEFGVAATHVAEPRRLTDICYKRRVGGCSR